MSNVLPFRSWRKGRGERYEKACLWIVKLSAGVSQSEMHELHAWLRENPGNVAALMEAARLWDQLSVLSELSDLFPLEHYLAPRPSRSARRLCAALAAVVLLFFIHSPLVGWVKDYWAGHGAWSMPLSYETRIGEQRAIRLPDGSEMTLNTNSRVEVAYGETERNIHLHRGEVHFSVEKDAARPFRVHADGGIVEAVGTAFTVQQAGEKVLEVTVIEGVVNFTRTRPAPGTAVQATAPTSPQAAALAAAETIPLTAGEGVEVSEDDEVVQKQRIQANALQSRLAWRHGMLLFQGDPLDRVIAEVSRYTSMRIEVDESIRDIQVLGYFRTGDVEAVLLSMQDTFNLRVERVNENHVVLKPRL